MSNPPPAGGKQVEERWKLAETVTEQVATRQVALSLRGAMQVQGKGGASSCSPRYRRAAQRVCVVRGLRSSVQQRRGSSPAACLQVGDERLKVGDI